MFDALILAALTLLIFLVGYRWDVISSFQLQTKRNLERDVVNVGTSNLWIESKGQVIWSNRVYRKTAEWFDQPLFFSHFETETELVPESDWQRATLQKPGEDEVFHFFMRCLETKDFIIYTAASANHVMKMEEEKERLVQTLTSAFSELPIGIAVFDESHDLALFNPALGSLFDINPVWLAKKPSLEDFLNYLRDQGKIPEPKNFSEWRDTILQLQNSNQTANYKDDWHTPSGGIVRVNGSTKGNGTITFNFEDISRSNIIEREYRLEIERLYSVIDSMDSALVILDASGAALHFNPVFDTLWDTNFQNTLSLPSIEELCEIWRNKCQPVPIWAELCEFSTQMIERAPWSHDIITNEGKGLNLFVTPLSDGFTLIEFILRPQTSVKKPKSPQTERKKSARASL